MIREQQRLGLHQLRGEEEGSVTDGDGEDEGGGRKRVAARTGGAGGGGAVAPTGRQRGLPRGGAAARTGRRRLARERRLPPATFRVENPFSVEVLQVFTGFGVGVGRPIYLDEWSMIPGLQQVMSATRDATDAFSGVTRQRHVNSALWTAGLKNIEAGIGCGVGIGHGFGIGGSYSKKLTP
ncbi:hypothetical protein ACP70R_048429 [Stipagrostis hirtigluma subsp. patula]